MPVRPCGAKIRTLSASACPASGRPEAAHGRGVEFVSRLMLETLDQPVDAVITTGAGYPLDLTFYQSIKGITAASHILKPGGSILLAAACEEGAGAPEFSNMLREGVSDNEFLDRIAGAPVVVDQWQLEKLALVTRQSRVYYYAPGLPEEYRAKLWGWGASAGDVMAGIVAEHHLVAQPGRRSVRGAQLGVRPHRPQQHEHRPRHGRQGRADAHGVLTTRSDLEGARRKEQTGELGAPAVARGRHDGGELALDVLGEAHAVISPGA